MPACVAAPLKVAIALSIADRLSVWPLRGHVIAIYAGFVGAEKEKKKKNEHAGQPRGARVDKHIEIEKSNQSRWQSLSFSLLLAIKKLSAREWFVRGKSLVYG